MSFSSKLEVTPKRYLSYRGVNNLSETFGFKKEALDDHNLEGKDRKGCVSAADLAK